MLNQKYTHEKHTPKNTLNTKIHDTQRKPHKHNLNKNSTFRVKVTATHRV